MPPWLAVGAGSALAGGLMSLIGNHSYTVPQYSDINLQKENPELFKRLQQNDDMLKQARALYDRRRQGMTGTEAEMYNNAMARGGAAIANEGLAGTSEGLQVANHNAMDYANNVNDRIYNESNQLFGNLQNAQRGNYDAYSSALQQTMAPKMAQYQANLANNTARNQFASGLMNGGIQSIGAGMNADRLMGMMGAAPSPYSAAAMTNNFSMPVMGQSSFAPLQYGLGGQLNFGVPGYP